MRIQKKKKNKNQIVSLVWLRKSLFVGVSFFVFAATSLAILLWPRTYTATARLLLEARPLSQNIREDNQSQYHQNFLATQIEILQSARVALRAGDMLALSENKIALERFRKERVGSESFAQFYIELLKRSISARQVGNASVIEVTYTANDPSAAAQAANAFTRAYIAVNKELRINDDQRSNAIILDEAAVPSSPISPRVIPGFILAILLSPLIGLFAVLLSEALDRRVRSRLDLEEISGVSVLCIVGAGRPSRTLVILQTMISFFTPNAKPRPL